jgi:hypothetical protein
MAGLEGLWNYLIYSHSTRAGFHLRRKKSLPANPGSFYLPFVTGYLSYFRTCRRLGEKLYIYRHNKSPIVDNRRLSRKEEDGSTKQRTSLDPVPPVGMRTLSSDPMKVFPCQRAKRMEKCEELKKNEHTQNSCHPAGTSAGGDGDGTDGERV